MSSWLGAVNIFAAMLAMAAVLACPALAASDAAPTPVIRTEISPRQAMVGQTVTLKIDVLVPSWFTAPIDYPAAINLAGVTGQLSNSAAINLNERIDNQSYAGMSKLYTVVAQQAGEFKLPSLPVKIAYSVDGATRTMTLQTTPQTFRAALPAGAEDLGYFFATPNYSLKQTTDRQLHHLKVGDAIVRRITQRAEGVAAMNLPGLSFAEIDGSSIYPAEAQLEDTGGERGKVRVGERVDAVTYILRKPGLIELPGLKIGWFDTANGKMRWASVPTLRFEVAPDPRATSSAIPPPQPTNSVSPAPTDEITLRTRLMRAWRSPTALPTLGVLGGLLLIAFLLKRKGIKPMSAWHTWQQRRSNAEPAHFKRCITHMRDADATQALNATMRWLNQVTPNGRGASLTQFAANYGDEKFRQYIRQLQDQLFAQGVLLNPGMAGSPNRGDVDEKKWNLAGYRKALVGARRCWLDQQRAALQTRPSLLALNPSSE